MVTTRSGRVRGVEREDGALVWKNIPYVAPPTGPRRYAPPQPVQPWTGVREATEYGTVSPQVPVLPWLPPTPNQNEDCLNLNVWSPSTTGKRPVIVWVHGGGFVAGTGNDPTFDGTQYVQRDCVLVTFNYRLGAFGSLYQSDRPGSGNLRLLDQIAALRWVRDNIAAFGGDPWNVTVMGESAGGMSIGALLGTPKARGLFHRAILQSGGPRPTETPAVASVTTRTVMDYLGITDPARLMSVSADELLDASAQAAGNADLPEYGHVIDGVVLPEHPLKAVGGDVDLLIGTCNKEYESFVDSPMFRARFERETRRTTGAAFDHLLKAYEDTTTSGRTPLYDVVSGWFVVMPSVWLAEFAHRAGARVWQYRFDYEGASPGGARHGSDIQFTFSNWGQGDFVGAEPADLPTAEAVSSKMIDSFAAFASKGTPSTRSVPHWPAFTPRDRACMSFDVEPRLIQGPLSEARRREWDAVNPFAF
ncbi:carboxylesterase/lipase family protein [Streptomyces sp. NPDC101234]|uniref:carboxylesterase/lipase family protein n=1 Tax=Streptomyces sp. NPDC101234 TaxID=3366138 RepID=UPI0037FAA0CD